MSGSVATVAPGELGTDELDGLPVWVFEEGEPIVDGYLAWERLGIGTRCETWLSWSMSMWSPVVVKLLRPHQVDHSRGAAAIAREGGALSAITHPAVPRLWRDARHAPVPHLVIEYVDGVDLDDVLDESGPMAKPDLVQLGAQVGAALRAVHQAGFAHLDIKPDNIGVRDSRLVVLDFGSARPLGRSQPTGHPIGSAGYASPDLESGADISAAMDVYGLGVLLAEAATDARVFASEVAPAERRPVALPVTLDAALRELIAAMLAHRAGDRPAIDAVLAALADLDDVSDDREPLWPHRATGHLRAT